MKVFRYLLGHEAGKTLTVAEFRAKLEEYPGNMPVMATWEGVEAYIEPQNFCVKKTDKGNREDECECLIIDVEKY